MRVGTRGSALALAQSGQVADAVAAALAASGSASGSTASTVPQGFPESAPAVAVELVRIRTEGDVNRAALASIGGTGVFVTAVRQALRDGTVDLVVHSAKDLPTAPESDLRLAAVPAREDPADALCSKDGRGLAELAPGARIGTGSPRRAAQLLARRPDLEVVPIRGNVDTRLGYVDSGELDAVLLAAAGLRRLGRAERISQRLDPSEFVPAPAQGALAVETAAHPEVPWYQTGLAAIDDLPTRLAAAAERAVLAGLEAGCSAPVSALAVPDGDMLLLTAQVTAPDGSAQLTRQLRFPLPGTVAGRDGTGVDEPGSAGADGADNADGAAGIAGTGVDPTAIAALEAPAVAAGLELASGLLADGAAGLMGRT
nr:hydroxymethylbilane synthase [Nakamurella aerolata]